MLEKVGQADPDPTFSFLLAATVLSAIHHHDSSHHVDLLDRFDEPPESS
jgi:hypothetical protein